MTCYCLVLPSTGVPVDSDAKGFLFESPIDSRPPISYKIVAFYYLALHIRDLPTQVGGGRSQPPLNLLLPSQ